MATETMDNINSTNQITVSSEQDILVLWLDGYIDHSNQNYPNAMTQLQQVVHDIQTFHDDDECIRFILNTTDTKVCMIISESLGQHIVPCIHDIIQIDSIFIFGSEQNQYERWVKVKGVFRDITNICQQLQLIIRHYERNDRSISFVPSGRQLNQLDPSFMYTQIIKEILLTIEFNAQHINEFVNYYCDAFLNNEIDRSKVKQLELQYYQHTPVWWYTTERFLYGTLNRALRVMNGEVITLMGFFISDLHRHIEELHKQKFENISSVESFTVYRGQSINKKDFNEMIKSKGGLMSFNNFLSTSRNRDVSLLFLPTNENSNDMVNILFVIKADPAQSTTPFASVRDIGNFEEEDEILFSYT